jgi:serine/threonine protein kinase
MVGVPVMASWLLQSLVKNTIKYVGDGVTGGIIPIGSIASGMYEDWCRSSKVEQANPEPIAALAPPTPQAQNDLRIELEKIAQDPRAYRQELEQMLSNENLTPEQRQLVLTYLNQLPGRIQASMKRPEDPTGRTIPPGMSLRRAEDFNIFLPDRMPRFKPGDRAVLGTDLVVEELLGVGGFGEVWKAVHKSRPHAPAVALKFCTDEAAARTLRKEVELLDRVANQGRHPGIVELKYAHLEGETPCLEYEYVDGGDLGALIADLHFSEKATPLMMTKILYSLAQAVGHAHRLKPPIVHRDLKPQNVLVTRVEGKTRLKVADFGIGGIASDINIQEWNNETTQSRSGMTQSAGSCTPLYASIQQRRFGPPDPRDDVYALGVIWYQMLLGDITKEPPRGGAWKKKFIEQGSKREWIELLERCLEDEASERPRDAAELSDELGNLIKGKEDGETKPASSAHLPPVVSAFPEHEQFYYLTNGQQLGPVSLEELRELVRTRKITPSDLVWSNSIGNWSAILSVPGLLQPQPPAPPTLPTPPPPPVAPIQSLAAATQAKVRFIIPPSGDLVRDLAQTAAKAYVKLYSLGMLGGKLTGVETFKFFLNGRLINEGPLKDGFEFEAEFPIGTYQLVVAHWKGGQEIDKKQFDLRCPKPGDYDIRFNYVKSAMGGMASSTIELIRDPSLNIRTTNPALAPTSAYPAVQPASAYPAVNTHPATTTAVLTAVGAQNVQFKLGFLATEGFFNRMALTSDAYKVFLDEKLVSDQKSADGFDIQRQIGLGEHIVDIVFLHSGSEKCRKRFMLNFPVPGRYEYRFSPAIEKGVFSTSMDKSTLDLIEAP